MSPRPEPPAVAGEPGESAGAPAHRVVFGNFMALSALQASNYLLPLVTIPYLTRTIGIDAFGLVSFGQAFANLFFVLTEYGFSLWAANQIARHRDDLVRVATVTSTVCVSRGLLVAAAGVIAIVATVSSDRLRADWPVFALSYGQVVIQAFNIDWLFQGFERMQFMTITSVCAKVLFTASIFLIVRRPEDYLIVPASHILGLLVSVVLAWSLARAQLGVRFRRPSLSMVWRALAEGWHLFVSRAFSGIYTFSNTLVLGFLSSDTVVGYFTLVERVTMAVSGLFVPFNSAVYPFLSRKFDQEAAAFRATTLRILGGLAIAVCLLAAIVVIQAELIVRLAAGVSSPLAVLLLRVLAASIVLAPLTAYLTQVLVIQDRTRRLMASVTTAGVLHLIGLATVVPFYGALGLALVVAAVQAVAASLVAMFVFARPADLERAASITGSTVSD